MNNKQRYIFNASLCHLMKTYGFFNTVKEEEERSSFQNQVQNTNRQEINSIQGKKEPEADYIYTPTLCFLKSFYVISRYKSNSHEYKKFLVFSHFLTWEQHSVSLSPAVQNNMGFQGPLL